MSKDSNGTTGGGLGLSGVLLVVFIVLKLCKVITWSWVWVLSPLWISLVIWGGYSFNMGNHTFNNKKA